MTHHNRNGGDGDEDGSESKGFSDHLIAQGKQAVSKDSGWLAEFWLGHLAVLSVRV